MLQQTTVATVRPRFEDFIARWPRMEDLAQAQESQVLQAWSGLGYYRRARFLHACARAVMAQHGGRLPDDPAQLAHLPGIGPYTAGAIAAIAFDRPEAAVDGNIERVLARVLDIDTPLPAAKPELRQAAARLVPPRRAGDYTQALMDLGTAICTPRAPDCSACPLAQLCQGQWAGHASSLPVRAPTKTKTELHEMAYWLEDARGRVLLRHRPEDGLLGGLLDLPCYALNAGDIPTPAQIRRHAPLLADWRLQKPPVRHIFTHRILLRHLATARLSETIRAPQGAFWLDAAAIASEGISTLFDKTRRMAVKHLTRSLCFLTLGLGLAGAATAAEPTPAPAAPPVVSEPVAAASTPSPTATPNPLPRRSRLSGDAVVEDPSTITFLPVTLDRLASLLLRFKAVDIGRDDVIDDFARLFQCEIYEYNHQDEFLWKKAQVALRRDIQKRFTRLPTHLEFVATRRLGKYDFKRHLFLLHHDSPINKLSSFTFAFTDQEIDVPCLADAPATWFPYTYKVSLDYPLTLEGLPMNEEQAKALLNSMLQNDNQERVIHVRFRFDVVHVPTIRKQKTDVDMEAEMQQVDFFADKEMRQLIYAYQPFYQ